jgi:hypothetical protein
MLDILNWGLDDIDVRFPECECGCCCICNEQPGNSKTNGEKNQKAHKQNNQK